MASKKSIESAQSRFGSRIRAYRNDLGWSQEDLAERTGLHWTFIGRLERGKGNPTLKTMVKLAEAFSVQPKDLLD